ncbi:MAG: dTDP-4-dehydrorhamnose reductase [Ignavibacteriae bacterium]|nr:MAG: dTDP-4-dehydrorhamnose reductase [Ignavibacteriota bacterium]
MEQLKRILLTGANGLLGQKTAEIFAKESDHELFLTDLAERAEEPRKFKYFPLDITNKEAVKEKVKELNPDIIINAAAYTNVDGCETERELSWRVNVDAVKNFIIASRYNSTKVIHVSTDYIFDGKTGNYDEQSRPSPKSFYGKEKLASENALISSGIEHAIIRTMIIYGNGKNVKRNFALWLIDMLGKNHTVTIVDDQYGQPTMVDDLGLALLRIVERNKKGIYHVSGSEYLNRYEFAIRLAEIFDFDKELIIPIKTTDLQQAADRPMNSSFITLKAETELGLKALNVTDGLYMLKHQLGM